MQRRNRKRAAVLAGLALLSLFLLTACGIRDMDGEEWLGFLDGLAGKLGASQITADADLLGERVCQGDAYTGNYLAECDGGTGRDVIFGGGSTESRRLQVSGRVLAESGKAVVRIRMNDEVVELETDGDGRFEVELSLKSGGNYIMVDYRDFTGTVVMESVQLPPKRIRGKQSGYVASRFGTD